jgi:excisionase family DNA binding protein
MDSRLKPSEAEILRRYPDLQSLAETLKPLCTVGEVADALRLSKKSVRIYIARGELVAARGGDGSRVLVPRVEVLRHVAQRFVCAEVLPR